MELIGWTPPHPETAIFESSVFDEIAFGLRNQKKSEEQVRERVETTAGNLGLAGELLRQSPYNLSGGEKRRVALASVMAMDYHYYVFDEPTAGLDYAGLKAFMGELQLLRESGCGVVWIGHDHHAMGKIADRFVWLEGGKFKHEGEYFERYKSC